MNEEKFEIANRIRGKLEIVRGGREPKISLSCSCELNLDKKDELVPSIMQILNEMNEKLKEV